MPNSSTDSPPIAIISAVWGDYWPRFGREWCDWISRMTPQPAEVVIVSAETLVAPPWVRQHRAVSDVPMWDWFNEAVSHARSEWIIILGIDDLILPLAFDGLALAGDVVAIAGVQNGELWAADADGYSRLFELTHNPMHCGAVFRRDVFLRFPWQRVIWPDEYQWVEFHHSGNDVRFDRRPRFIHRRHDGAHSMNELPDGDAQIASLKASLTSE